MAKTRRERVEQWRDHVDELCHDGERVEHRTDLEDATVAVTNQRVLALTPGASDGNFRRVDRPNVGTVTVETSERLRHLCAGIVAAFVGVGVLAVTTDVSFATLAPGADLEGVGSIPEPNALTRVAESVLAAVETALVLVEWGVLLLGVAALAIAAGLVGSYLRSRSRQLVLRVSGGDDLVLPVSGELDDEEIADLERAIRPGSAPELEGEIGGGSDRGSEPAIGERTGAEESG